jgi:hypothetical protein
MWYSPIEFADDHAVLVLPLRVLAAIEVVNNNFCSGVAVVVLDVQIFSGMHTLDVEIHILTALSRRRY